MKHARASGSNGLLIGMVCLSLLAACQTKVTPTASGESRVGRDNGVAIKVGGPSFRLVPGDGKTLGGNLAIQAGEKTFSSQNGTFQLSEAEQRHIKEIAKGIFRVYVTGYAPRTVNLAQSDDAIALAPLTGLASQNGMTQAGGTLKSSGGAFALSVTPGMLLNEKTNVALSSYLPPIDANTQANFTKHRKAFVDNLTKAGVKPRAGAAVGACGDPLPCPPAALSVGMLLTVDGQLSPGALTSQLDLRAMMRGWDGTGTPPWEADPAGWSEEQIAQAKSAAAIFEVFKQIDARPDGAQYREILQQTHGLSLDGNTLTFAVPVGGQAQIDGYVRTEVAGLAVLGVQLEVTVVSAVNGSLPPAASVPELIALNPRTPEQPANPNMTPTRIDYGPLGLDASPLIGQDGAGLAAAGASSLLGLTSAGIISNDGASIISGGAGNIISNDGASLLGQDGAGIMSGGAGNIISNDGASLLGQLGASIISNDGASIVAGGAGNIIGQGPFPSVIANDGASLVSGGAGNLVSNVGGSLMGHVMLPDPPANNSAKFRLGAGGGSALAGLPGYTENPAGGGEVRAVTMDGSPLSEWVPVDANGNYVIYRLPPSPTLICVESRIGGMSTYGLAMAPRHGRVFSHMNAGSTAVTSAIQEAIAAGTVVPEAAWLFKYNVDVAIARLLMNQAQAYEAVTTSRPQTAAVIRNEFQLKPIPALTFGGGLQLQGVSTVANNVPGATSVTMDTLNGTVYAGAGDANVYRLTNPPNAVVYQTMSSAVKGVSWSAGSLWISVSNFDIAAMNPFSASLPAYGGSAAVVKATVSGTPLAIEDYTLNHNPSEVLVATSTNSAITAFTTTTKIVAIMTGTGAVRDIAGDTEGFRNGAGANVRFNLPAALARDGNKLYVADSGNHCIRLVDLTTKEVTVYAGRFNPASGGDLAGVRGSDNGPRLQATFDDPAGLALTPDGDLFVADRGNHKIRLITAAGVVRDVAGTGSGGASDQSPASFSSPRGLFYDKKVKALFVADTGNNSIRKLDF